jgi:hypothetical protein
MSYPPNEGDAARKHEDIFPRFNPQVRQEKFSLQTSLNLHVLILCSTPPHSSSFQPTPAKVGFSLNSWLDLA